MNNKIFSLNKFRLCDFEFDINLARANDLDRMIYLLPKLNRSVVIPSVNYHYRLRASSISKTKKSSDFEVVEKLIERWNIIQLNSKERKAYVKFIYNILYKKMSDQFQKREDMSLLSEVIKKSDKLGMLSGLNKKTMILRSPNQIRKIYFLIKRLISRNHLKLDKNFEYFK